MANDRFDKTPSPSTEEKTSSGSSSSESGSTPNTPPTPTVQPVQPVTPEQAVVRPQPQTTILAQNGQNGRYSANGKSPKSGTPKSRLGAIDEDSDAVSPDLPARNPLRKLGFPPMKFSLPNIPTLYASRNPPANIYDDVEGPRGEKFADVRSNKKFDKSNPRTWFRGWAALVCIGCLVLIVGAIVAIAVIVALRVRKNHQSTSNTTTNTNTTTPAGTGAFPAGKYSITSYLDDVQTSCVSNAATWRCYPYETYNQSVSASLSTLNWVVSSQNGSAYTISSADQLFSYSFQNLPLQRVNNGTEDEHWGFTYIFDKVVIPSTNITADGASTKCFFNSTALTGKLYTKKPKAQALQNSTASTTGGNNEYQPWPYAIEFKEEHNNAAPTPDCYKTVNGQLGQYVFVEPVTSLAIDPLNCTCGYTDTP